MAGRFREVAAEAKVDTNGRVTADLRIDVSSVDTGNARRDKHLRSEDFLDVDTFPSLLVVVDHVEPTGPTQALVCAHLCIAGTVLPIELEATF